MPSDKVPFFDSLSSIYDSAILPEQTKRFQKLYDEFKSLYSVPPSHIVRAPGRVNLIVCTKIMYLTQGEHIDYSNFSVLPMAIAPDILVALSIRTTKESPSTISLANTNPRFPKRTIEIDTSNAKHPVDIDSKTLGTSRHCTDLRRMEQLLQGRVLGPCNVP
jgi:galactokinase